MRLQALGLGERYGSRPNVIQSGTICLDPCCAFDEIKHR
jgi:hypothetical protein